MAVAGGCEGLEMLLGAGFTFRSRHSDAPESRSPLLRLCLSLSGRPFVPPSALVAVVFPLYVVYRSDHAIVADFARGRSPVATRPTCPCTRAPCARTRALISRVLAWTRFGGNFISRLFTAAHPDRRVLHETCAIVRLRDFSLTFFPFDSVEL